LWVFVPFILLPLKRVTESRTKTGARRMDSNSPVGMIGKPVPPPTALVVAFAQRLAPSVRSARLRQMAANAAGLLALAALMAGCAFAAERLWEAGRGTAVAEALAAGLLLAAGAVVRERPLELGTGILARNSRGGIDALASMRGLVLLIPSTFRKMLEGAAYGFGLVRNDPAAELAAWVLLALTPPHGPGPWTWMSLAGVEVCGQAALSEDIKPALTALARHGFVEVSRRAYPPEARLTERGLRFVRGAG
jgi:hypothetical protein